MGGEEQLLRGHDEVWWISAVEAMWVMVLATRVVMRNWTLKVQDIVDEMPSVVDDVEQEVQVVVEVHVQEDRVEIVQHVVEDHEVAAVGLWIDEDQAQTRSQSEVVELTMSEQPYQNQWATESESSMSSGAKSSKNVSRRAGET